MRALRTDHFEAPVQGGRHGGPVQEDNKGGVPEDPLELQPGPEYDNKNVTAGAAGATTGLWYVCIISDQICLLSQVQKRMDKSHFI